MRSKIIAGAFGSVLIAAIWGFAIRYSSIGDWFKPSEVWESCANAWLIIISMLATVWGIYAFIKWVSK